MRYRNYQSFTAIWAIIAVSFMLFIATLIAPQLIYSFFGLTPALFLAQPWTIITNMFVHSGFFHLFANMLTLYFFGTFFTRIVGESKFLMVYFAGGILGNIFFILLGPQFIPAVGASGAVFALGGALAVMTPKLKVFVFPIPIPIPLWAAVIGGFFILSFLPFVAWQAHLGGLIFGLIAGYIFKRRMPHFSL
ncbi:rhomboid family intramembrane serine protease [Chloroflexota bacterium]